MSKTVFAGLPGKKPSACLDEVSERYGLRGPESPASSVPGEPASQQPRPTVSEPAGPNRPMLPVERMRPESPLELGGIRHPGIPPHRSPSGNQKFHYLIGVAECALTLHCEVTADSEPAARHRLKQIRNLLEWREISTQERAEIIKNEKSHSAAATT